MGDLAIGTLIGPYRVVRKLGEGGMGVVYETVHEAIGKKAAAKVLRPEASAGDAVERFFKEARATSQVQHPGMVQVFDFGKLPEGTAYLMMELLEGESLGARLSRLRGEGRRLPLASAAEIAQQIASALGAAHQQGIVHRDLKPDNVFLVRDPVAPGGERAKILDFGIAKFLVDSPVSGKTATGLILGTPTYMSPEQCEGREDLDPRLDVYSLGIIFYEMLAGRVPFSGEMSSAIMRQHMVKDPPPLSEAAPEVPAAIAALVHQMLAKWAAERPTMAQVVERLQGGAPAGAAVPPEAAPAAHAPGRRWLPGALAAAVVLAAGLGLALRAGPRTPQVAPAPPAAISRTVPPAPAAGVPPSPAPVPPAASAEAQGADEAGPPRAHPLHRRHARKTAEPAGHAEAPAPAPPPAAAPPPPPPRVTAPPPGKANRLDETWR